MHEAECTPPFADDARSCVPNEVRKEGNGATVGKTADLTLAKKRKKDEFYTQLVDIENELKHDKF